MVGKKAVILNTSKSDGVLTCKCWLKKSCMSVSFPYSTPKRFGLYPFLAEHHEGTPFLAMVLPKISYSLRVETPIESMIGTYNKYNFIGTQIAPRFIFLTLSTIPS